VLKRLPNELRHGDAALVGNLASALKQLGVYFDGFRRRCSHIWILSSLLWDRE